MDKDTRVEGSGGAAALALLVGPWLRRLVGLLRRRRMLVCMSIRVWVRVVGGGWNGGYCCHPRAIQSPEGNRLTEHIRVTGSAQHSRTAATFARVYGRCSVSAARVQQRVQQRRFPKGELRDVMPLAGREEGWRPTHIFSS